MRLGFRWKLVLAFGAITVVAAAVVALVATRLIRASFLRSDRERIEQVLRQARLVMERRGEWATRRVTAAAESEAAIRAAIALNQAAEGRPSPGAFLGEAGALARAHELELFELIAEDGTVLSSAHWEARAGYREPGVAGLASRGAPFVRLEELPSGAVLAMEAAREVNVGARKLYLLGGYRLDESFLRDISQAGLEHVVLFRLAGPGKLLATSEAPGAPQAERTAAVEKVLSRVAERVVSGGTDYRGELQPGELAPWSSTLAATPIRDAGGNTLGALLVTVSGAERARVISFLYAAALIAGALGLAAAMALSLLLANRITAPVRDLERASRELAAGNLEYRIPLRGDDEMARLSEAFNQMAAHLQDYRERLVQAERVAAWRELARRLAHELKNPLFPLQLSIENLRRARQVAPEHFSEVFEEGTATLLAELGELKRVVERFSDFAKMPRPEPQPTDLKTLLEKTARLYEARIRQENVTLEMRLGEGPLVAQADPQLLGQALGNLVLNALDAMPGGGRLELCAFAQNGRAVVEVADTGHGLTEEERRRLFTPYYTTKQHGTGLGLAIVQSVVADHGGRITVESAPDRGTRFRIELPASAS